MTSPVILLLWESWMMTWRAYAIRMMVILALVLLEIVLFEYQVWTNIEAVRFVLIQFCLMAGLSGLAVGRPLDGSRGFPFRHAFSRPASTGILVAVPLVYRTLWCSALYVVPITITHLWFEVTRTTLAAGLLFVPMTLMILANAWYSTSKGMVSVVTTIAVMIASASMIGFLLDFDELESGDDLTEFFDSFAYGVSDYLTIAAVSVAAIAVTCVGVSRQRIGEPWGLLQRSGSPDSNEDWFAELYQIECPTGSPKAAELWAEINGHGLPTIVRSLIAALLLPTLWMIANFADSQLFFWLVTTFIVITPLLAGTPDFGLQVKEGDARMSLFDATRPLSTPWLVATKLSVAVASITIGTVLIGISMWIAEPLLEGFILWIAMLKRFILDMVADESVWEVMLIAFVLFIQLSTMIAFLCASQAAYVLFGDRFSTAALFVFIYPAVPILLVATETVPLWVADAHIYATVAVLAAGAIYLLRTLAVNRVLGFLQLTALTGLWLCYAAAYCYGVWDAGLFSDGTPFAFLAFRAGLCLLSLLILAAAPLTFSMVRHGWR